jgi:hypothetical protein
MVWNGMVWYGMVDEQSGGGHNLFVSGVASIISYLSGHLTLTAFLLEKLIKFPFFKEILA